MAGHALVNHIVAGTSFLMKSCNSCLHLNSTLKRRCENCNARLSNNKPTQVTPSLQDRQAQLHKARTLVEYWAIRVKRSVDKWDESCKRVARLEKQIEKEKAKKAEQKKRTRAVVFKDTDFG